MKGDEDDPGLDYPVDNCKRLKHVLATNSVKGFNDQVAALLNLTVFYCFQEFGELSDVGILTAESGYTCIKYDVF